MVMATCRRLSSKNEHLWGLRCQSPPPQRKGSQSHRWPDQFSVLHPAKRGLLASLPGAAAGPGPLPPAQLPGEACSAPVLLPSALRRVVTVLGL